MRLKMLVYDHSKYYSDEFYTKHEIRGGPDTCAMGRELFKKFPTMNERIRFAMTSALAHGITGSITFTDRNIDPVAFDIFSGTGTITVTRQ